MITIRKRNNLYEYRFEAGKVNGKRKQITKSGFKTKNEAYLAGQKSYDEFINGEKVNECEMLYSEYLDYWMKEYFEVNYKYSTAKRYRESFSNIKKELGNYKLSKLTPYILKLPDVMGGMIDKIQSLQAGEALIIGDSIVVPSLVKIEECINKPSSVDIPYFDLWKEKWKDIDFKKLEKEWHK